MQLSQYIVGPVFASLRGSRHFAPGSGEIDEFSGQLSIRRGLHSATDWKRGATAARQGGRQENYQGVERMTFQGTVRMTFQSAARLCSFKKITCSLAISRMPDYINPYSRRLMRWSFQDQEHGNVGAATPRLLAVSEAHPENPRRFLKRRIKMSRSCRKTPIRGISNMDSDKPFKKAENKRARRAGNACDLTRDEPPAAKAFGNPCKSPKDGKRWIDSRRSPELMRK